MGYGKEMRKSARAKKKKARAAGKALKKSAKSTAKSGVKKAKAEGKQLKKTVKKAKRSSRRKNTARDAEQILYNHQFGKGQRHYGSGTNEVLRILGGKVKNIL